MSSAPDATPIGGDAARPAAAPPPPPPPGALQAYDMSGRREMVVFNHYQYQNFSEELRPRDGTARDAAALTRAFSALGFRVAVHTDLTHDQIMDVISDLSKGDHSDTACVCVAVLTHGDRGGRVAAADRWFELRDLVQPLQRAARLAGKPKLLLVQACRGGRRDAGLEYDGTFAAKIGTHADTLVFYSTVEDFVSFRGGDGSWMVQTLCRVLEREHRRHDLLRLTTLVTAAITREYTSHSTIEENNNKKQTPETCSTLTKLLYFTAPEPAPAPPAPPAPPALALAPAAGCRLID